ncbi:ATP-binding protein [[Clostridium] aminophilum]|uniref:Anti-sigma regulatory factor (Ser/Thr protein kinase) n=1 Tax=[Clostridium] aminophilum TaxID=1526 RepID=A0A1I6JS26_9FIRM|nr:ATP-binding protein [[Clostridium] aminophilum]SFR81789.1 Anti-sigma regulatory factor (Ser/Thr protein kinase) [[Clostridium] aminophilum]
MKEFHVDSNVENIPSVKNFVLSELEKLGCTERLMIQMKMAVDELFANISSYAYDSEAGPVTVQFDFEETSSAAVLTFIDEGKPYNPLEADEPDVELEADLRPIGGLGIFLVRNLMDDMLYEYKDGRNILTLKKYTHVLS